MGEDWSHAGADPLPRQPLAMRPRTSDASAAAFEADVSGDHRLAITAATEAGVAHDGDGTSAEAVHNGTTRYGTGGAETADDGKTFRGYGRGSSLIFRLDTAQSPAGYDLTEILSFAGHHDGRSSQNYTVLLAHAAEPMKFTRLGDALVSCATGASMLRLTARHGAVLDHGAGCRASGVVAVRFDFQDGLLGFNVYREFVLVGKPTPAPR
jgi:hypothetical protein